MVEMSEIRLTFFVKAFHEYATVRHKQCTSFDYVVILELY